MILFCGVSNQPGGQASAGPIGPAHFASAAHMCTPVPTPSVCGGWQAESGGALDGLKSREMAVAPGGPSSSSWTAIRVCPGAGIPQPGDPGRRRLGLGRPRTSTRCPAPPDRLLRRAGFRDPQDNDRSVRRTRPANPLRNPGSASAREAEPVSCLRTLERPAAGCGMPFCARISGNIKVLLRTPAAAPRDICGGSGRTGTFFCSYTARCRQDATAEGR